MNPDDIRDLTRRYALQCVRSDATALGIQCAIRCSDEHELSTNLAEKYLLPSNQATPELEHKLQSICEKQNLQKLSQITNLRERKEMLKSLFPAFLDSYGFSEVIEQEFKNRALLEFEAILDMQLRLTTERKSKINKCSKDVDSRIQQVRNFQLRLLGEEKNPLTLGEEKNPLTLEILSSSEDTDKFIQQIFPSHSNASASGGDSRSTNSTSTTNKNISFDDDVCIIESKSTASKKPAMLLEVQILLRGFSVKMNDRVLVKTESGSWKYGVVNQINFDASQNKTVAQMSCTVKLEASEETITRSSKEIASSDSLWKRNLMFPVGARVVAIYRDGSCLPAFWSAIVFESPTAPNKQRYLVAFDCGLFQYSSPNEVFGVVYQSVENWRSMAISLHEFACKYLQRYPERPMLRLKKGEVVTTLCAGAWHRATVLEVDASLVLMDFPNNTKEWLYRGSLRFETLNNELVRAENSHSGRARKHTGGRATGPVVEYVQDDDDSNNSAERQYVARKSGASKTQTSALPGNVSGTDNPLMHRSISNRELTSHGNNLQRSNSVAHSLNSSSTTRPDVRVTGRENSGIFISPLAKFLEARKRPTSYTPHVCSSKCLKWRHPDGSLLTSDDPRRWKGSNPLAIPIYTGWWRSLYAVENCHKRLSAIIYVTPCGLRVKKMYELIRYLQTTQSRLSVELFCFDVEISVNREFKATQVYTMIEDFSEGRENVPISCVNSVDNEKPAHFEYRPWRFVKCDAVNLNEEPGFRVACDCTIDCNSTNCSCRDLTFEASTLVHPLRTVNRTASYRFRRLLGPLLGGIYECNDQCRCDERCGNRLVQHGLWVKLQLFKTEMKGWGIRALNDIPKGTFLCVYSGAIYDDATANTTGAIEGDEYLADIDYIEMVERPKEGFEEENSDDSDKESDESRSVSTHSSRGESKKSQKKTTNNEQNNQEGSKNAAPKSARRHTAPPIPIINNPNSRSTREFLSNDDMPYVMDAKQAGNIGRYFNHSCDPNIFVQNVFVHSHDPRVPEIAFFTLQNVLAGQELTWDYNYEVGSVPNRKLFCHCKSAKCRGRLL